MESREKMELSKILNDTEWNYFLYHSMNDEWVNGIWEKYRNKQASYDDVIICEYNFYVKLKRDNKIDLILAD
jgi:hypothetical protein